MKADEEQYAKAIEDAHCIVIGQFNALTSADTLQTINSLNCEPGIGRGSLDQGHCEYESQTVGRNDICPCGSGKKFKRCCHGKTRTRKCQARWSDK